MSSGAKTVAIIQNVLNCVLVSIVVSIPACHAGDRGSIPRRGGVHFFALRDGQIFLNGVILLTCKDIQRLNLHAIFFQWWNSHLPHDWPGFESQPMQNCLLKVCGIYVPSNGNAEEAGGPQNKRAAVSVV